MICANRVLFDLLVQENATHGIITGFAPGRAKALASAADQSSGGPAGGGARLSYGNHQVTGHTSHPQTK